MSLGTDKKRRYSFFFSLQDSKGPVTLISDTMGHELHSFHNYVHVLRFSRCSELEDFFENATLLIRNLRPKGVRGWTCKHTMDNDG